jgi:hypothetical protein
MATPALPPLPSPIFCLPDCVAQQSTTLVLRNKIFSFGDAKIKDLDDNVMFTVRAKALSFSQRKEVYDSKGTHLFTVRREPMSFPQAFYCEAPDGTRFMDVDGKFMLPLIAGHVQRLNQSYSDKAEVRCIVYQ